MADDDTRDERLGRLLEVEPLDELARRRLVTTAMRGVGAPGAEPPRRPGAEPARGRRRGRRDRGGRRLQLPRTPRGRQHRAEREPGTAGHHGGRYGEVGVAAIVEPEVWRSPMRTAPRRPATQHRHACSATSAISLSPANLDRVRTSTASSAFGTTTAQDQSDERVPRRAARSTGVRGRVARRHHRRDRYRALRRPRRDRRGDRAA